MSRVIAIGDIHGCAAALQAMLEQIEPLPDDTIVTLGDCVDRGPDSFAVIEELLRLREKCRLVPLLGNHEEMMLNYFDRRVQPDDWLSFGGKATIDSYAKSGHENTLPDAHVEFIRSWGDYWETDKNFFVHGGYNPDQPLDRQRWQLWRWHSLRDSIPEPHVSGKIAVVGHTSQKDGEILEAGHLVCIDTFCCGGGWLTALEPATGRVWQVDRNGRLRRGNDS